MKTMTGILALALAAWLPAALAAQAAVFPGAQWEEASPESQGVDGGKPKEAVELLARTVGKDGARELVVIRHGRMIWKGDTIDKRHGIWSATKSFTSTMLGLLIAEGKCTLDTRAVDVLEKENHLDAVLGTINAGLMGITIQLDEFLERALANLKTVDQVQRLLPFLQTYLQVARQVDRFAQLELRLTASRKANSADSAHRRPQRLRADLRPRGGTVQ